MNEPNLKQEIETERHLQKLIEKLKPKNQKILISCKNCKSQYYQSLDIKFIYIDIDNEKYISCPYCDEIIYLK